MKVGVSRWKGTSESLEDPQGSGVYFGISGGVLRARGALRMKGGVSIHVVEDLEVKGIFS